DVDLVDELRLLHRGALQGFLQVGECAHPIAVVVVDPPVGEVVDGRSVQVVQLLPATPQRRNQAGLLQDREMLAHRLPGHLKAGAQPGIGRYPPQIEAAVYFCCLEALNNAAKHAGASARATITARQDATTLTVTITDTGRGYNPATTTHGTGLTNIAD